MAASWRDDPAWPDVWPDVDVVMPIRNEAPHLAAAIDSVRAQHYPGKLRIILGVGPSDDGTEALADAMAGEADDLLVVANPTGKTPAALNLAIRAGSAPVIVRVDGHSVLSPGYIEQAVATLQSTGAVNVGGVQRPEATTPFEEAVSDATTSLLGTGGASYRVGATAGAVDTVYLGVFDRDAIEAVGLFDATLIRNQDYELNIRLRAAGGTVWFDPALSVGYTPRATWKALATQYYEYGWWKSVVMRKHPHSIRVRQVIPPLGVLGVIAGLVVGSKWRPALIVPVAYAGAMAVSTRSTKRPLLTAGVLGVIHSTWAAGLLRGFAKR